MRIVREQALRPTSTIPSIKLVRTRRAKYVVKLAPCRVCLTMTLELCVSKLVRRAHNGKSGLIYDERAETSGSVLGNRHLADRRDGARATLEARPQEFLDCIHVVGLDDVEQRVLRVRAVTANQPEPRHVRV